jgi:hypothetical protein
VNAAIPDGTACADTTVCNGAETCQAGLCRVGTALDCNDANPCTSDSCDATLGCRHTAVGNGTPCSDGNACNGAEQCQGGACASGVPLVCNDGNTCTTDSCDPVAGCRFTAIPDGSTCGDGNVCNGAETCQSGACRAGTPLTCTDGNRCTSDTCDPATGCRYTGLGDGASCSDGNLCNGLETCQAGACTSGTAVNCNDNSYCTTDLCSPTTGCYHTPVVNGASCSDSNPCNGIEVCQGGVCAAGTPLNCNDSNPCTADSCTAAGGCQQTAVANGTVCSDGNTCNGLETCQNGACAQGTSLSCNDTNPCTTDSCDAQTGCRFTAVADGTACPDADLCDGAEACQGGTCSAGTPVACNDGNACTQDSCDSALGCRAVAVANGTLCTDGNGCNGAETCQAGVCTPGTALACGDGNTCTTDSCDPVAGCRHTAVANGTSCRDTDLCDGAEACQTGVCRPGTPLSCVDGNACTNETCNASAGCQYTAVPNGTTCADGNLCNGEETCQSAVCSAGASLDCDDGNACSTDTCNAGSGCAHTVNPAGTPCSDGNACNGAETCAGGVCVAGSALPDGVPCSDGDMCDGLETCRASACIEGTALSCDDGNPNTVDACSPSTGCQNDVLIPATTLSLRPLIATTLLKVATKGAIDLSTPPSNGGTADPVVHGASVRIVTAGGGFDVTYDLPAATWAYLGRAGANLGYRYRDRRGDLSPVRSILVKGRGTSKLSVSWPGAAPSLAQDPSPFRVELTLGGTRYCMAFGGTTSFVPNARFSARNAPAPVSCAP